MPCFKNRKQLITLSVILLSIPWIASADVYADIIVTEVLTYAGTTGSSEDDCYQFIELYNSGTSEVNVQDWRITDGDAEDILKAYNEGYHGDITDPDCVFSTVIPAGGYGVIIDPEYTDGPSGQVFDFPSGTRIITVDNSSALGNTLAHYTDPVTLYTWDGNQADIKSTYGTPDLSNLSSPTTFDDNGLDCIPCRTRKHYSVERKDIFGDDVVTNWGLGSPLWGTPGAANTKSDKGDFDEIIITEVYANPAGSASDNPPPFTAEDTDEFVEIANTSSLSIDVCHWWITDGDSIDRVIPYDESTHGDITDTDVITDTTVLPAGSVAVILDPDYASGTQPFDFPADTIVLTCTGTSDSIGGGSKPSSGLTASSDPVTLFALRAGNTDPDNDGTYEFDVANIASTYGTPELSDLSHFIKLDDDGQDGIPFNPGSDYTVEMIDLTQGDVESNWQASADPYGTPGYCSNIPQNPSVVIDEGDYTQDPTIHLTLAASQADEMIISENQNFSEASWEPYATTRTWVLSAGDELKTIYVKYKGALGEESEVVSDSIVLNTGGSGLTKVGSFNNDGSVFWIELKGNYAYVADQYDGLEILDITNIDNITLVDSYFDGGEAFKVKVRGNYAYVADWMGGLEILDVSDPSNIQKLSTFAENFEILGLEVIGSTVYLACGFDGVKVMDVSDPRNPAEIVTYDTPDFAFDVVACGRLLYVADYTGGLLILNITDPENISRLGRYTDVTGRTRNIFVTNKLVYLANKEGGLEVVDVSDPTNIQRVGTFSVSGSEEARGIMVKGKYAYLANFVGGLTILDISDLNNIQEVANYYDGSGNTKMSLIQGDLIFVADAEGGMEVLQTDTFIDEDAGTLVLIGGKRP